MSIAWLNQIWQAGQVNEGNVVRRSMLSVATYSSPQDLENEVRARGFHMALIGSQYVIVCNPNGALNLVC